MKKELVKKVLTKYPQLQREIVDKLKDLGLTISTRDLRSVFNKINKDYINGDIDYVVISNRNGTYISDNIEDIKKFNKAKIKHAKSELWSAYNINKRINNKDQMTIYEFLKENL